MALGRKPIEIVESGTHQLLVKSDSWERVWLHQVAEVKNGFAFQSKFFNHDSGLPLIRIRDISKTATENLYSGKFEEEYLVLKGEILIGMDGDFNCARWQGKQALLNQRVCKIIPTTELYSDKFLYLCLQPYLNAINQETSSITVKHLSSKTVEEIPLPLPPLNEQHRIVAKIEELFSELDKGVESLKQAREQLKVYRQSLLKHAFEGKLTEQWRKENADKLETAEQLLERIKHEREARYQQQLKEWKAAIEQWEKDGKVGKRPSKPKKELELQALSEEEISQLPLPPEEWKWVKLDTMGYLVCGQSPSVNEVNIEGKGMLYVTGPEQWNGRDIEETKWTEHPKRIAPEDSIFITVKGAGVGKLFPGKMCAIGRDVYAFCPLKPIVPAFIVYALKHSIDLVVLQAKGDIPGLSKNHIMDHVIGLPPTIEQQQIVEELDRQMTDIDNLMETLNSQLLKSEALRQSILKKAFSGQLVPQDPNDEPASVLLERIAREKADAATPRKSRIAKTAQIVQPLDENA